MNKATLKKFAEKVDQIKTQVEDSIIQTNKLLATFEGAEELDEMDQSLNLTEITRLKNLLHQYNTRIIQIKGAEQRLSSGKFGTCLVCEEEIPSNRLMANPLSIRCLECQEDLEAVAKENKMKKSSGYTREDYSSENDEE